MQIGDVLIDRFEVVRILGGPGKSGMGIVYVVDDRMERRLRAVKTYQDELFQDDPSTADRFRREAEAWISLPPYDHIASADLLLNHYTLTGRRSGGEKPYLFLEYVSGGDLRQWIGTSRLLGDLGRILQFGLDFCDGLTHAVENGIRAHRDIKPENCLVTSDGRLKVTDFGLAKVLDDVSFVSGREPARDLSRSRTGEASGTPLYMSPEQFEDTKHVDLRADVYSFGVMLFEMIRGVLPFQGRTWEEVARVHRTSDIPRLDTDPRLEEVVRTCLSKRPAARFQNFLEIRALLAGIYRGVTGAGAPSRKPAPPLDTGAYLNRGSHLHYLGRYDEALACYERALSLDPTLAHAILFNRGNTLVQLGRIDEALESYSRGGSAASLAKEPQIEASCWAARGEILLQRGEAADALYCCERARRLAPERGRIVYSQGRCYAALGRHEEALSCFEDFWVRPTPTVWQQRAVTLLMLSRHAEALDAAGESIALDPDDAESWCVRTEALALLGRLGDAIDSVERALELAPQSARARAVKGLVLQQAGRLDEAFVEFDAAISLVEQGHDQDRSVLEVVRGALQRIIEGGNPHPAQDAPVISREEGSGGLRPWTTRFRDSWCKSVVAQTIEQYSDLEESLRQRGLLVLEIDLNDKVLLSTVDERAMRLSTEDAVADVLREAPCEWDRSKRTVIVHTRMARDDAERVLASRPRFSGVPLVGVCCYGEGGCLLLGTGGFAAFVDWVWDEGEADSTDWSAIRAWLIGLSELR